MPASFFFEDDAGDTEVAFSTVPADESIAMLRAFLKIADPDARRWLLAHAQAMFEAQETNRAEAAE
ncbi:hypothetical protein BTE77_35245 [Ensifer adhaerens]|nr:hypothetical protein BTE77_35245 [Ensifer adhaerens]